MEPGISKQISSEGCSAFRVNERLNQPPVKFIEIEIYVRRNNKLQSQFRGRQEPSINCYSSVDAKQSKLFFFYMYACPEEGIGSSGNGVTDGCEMCCECWESSLDLLEKQPVLLTAGPFL